MALEIWEQLLKFKIGLGEKLLDSRRYIYPCVGAGTASCVRPRTCSPFGRSCFIEILRRSRIIQILILLGPPRLDRLDRLGRERLERLWLRGLVVSVRILSFLARCTATLGGLLCRTDRRSRSLHFIILRNNLRVAARRGRRENHVFVNETRTRWSETNQWSETRKKMRICKEYFVVFGNFGNVAFYLDS